jgi:hypothetical protein
MQQRLLTALEDQFDARLVVIKEKHQRELWAFDPTTPLQHVDPTMLGPGEGCEMLLFPQISFHQARNDGEEWHQAAALYFIKEDYEQAVAQYIVPLVDIWRNVAHPGDVLNFLNRTFNTTILGKSRKSVLLAAAALNNAKRDRLRVQSGSGSGLVGGAPASGSGGAAVAAGQPGATEAGDTGSVSSLRRRLVKSMKKKSQKKQ